VQGPGQQLGSVDQLESLQSFIIRYSYWYHAHTSGVVGTTLGGSNKFISSAYEKDPLLMRRDVNVFLSYHLTPVGGFPPGTPVSTNIYI